MIQGSPPAMRRLRAWGAAILAVLCASPGLRADDRAAAAAAPTARRAATAAVRPNQPAGLEAEDEAAIAGLAGLDPRAAGRTVQAVALFGLVSLAPMALLMLTGFIRISIVLTLLRQAIGSPQVPGNQVITALSLMLTALVMWPYGETIYREAIAPYAAGKAPLADAWDAGSRPIRSYMLRQLALTHHEGYLESLYESAAPDSPGRAEPVPRRPEDFPLRVIAPAFLLSEVTTGIMMGFYVYLPFLVVDLVVAAALAATGLFMLPPAYVAVPAKLALLYLSGGFLLVSTMLLSSFGPAGG